MDKVQRFEYTQQIESFMEENQVYELFEGLLQQLIVNKPDRPLDYLIDKLGAKPTKRIFLMGPPGSFRQDITTALCEEMGGYKSISPGDLFKKEIARKTEIGKRIMACFKAYHYVDY